MIMLTEQQIAEGWIEHDGTDKNPAPHLSFDECETLRRDGSIAGLPSSWGTWKLNPDMEVIAYRVKPNKGIHHLVMLQAFTRESETNPEPWKAFEVSVGMNSWIAMEPMDIGYVVQGRKTIRRIPKKKKVWQWLIRTPKGDYYLSYYKYKTLEEAQSNFLEGQVLRNIPESEEEVSE